MRLTLSIRVNRPLLSRQPGRQVIIRLRRQLGTHPALPGLVGDTLQPFRFEPLVRLHLRHRRAELVVAHLDQGDEAVLGSAVDEEDLPLVPACCCVGRGLRHFGAVGCSLWVAASLVSLRHLTDALPSTVRVGAVDQVEMAALRRWKSYVVGSVLLLDGVVRYGPMTFTLRAYRSAVYDCATWEKTQGVLHLNGVHIRNRQRTI